jgi:uncharacterized protein (TIGR00251 family)
MQSKIVYAKVIPNAKEFRVLDVDDERGEIRIKTRNPARNGKANQEIIEELEKKFGQKITIIKGHQSNRKIIRIG